MMMSMVAARRRGKIVTALLSAVLLCIAVASDARELVQPQEIHPSSKGDTVVNLEVRPHRVSIPLKLDNTDNDEWFFEYTGRFYFEEGKDTPSLPGPTLRASPGGKIKLTIKNELGEETADPNSVVMNSFHHPNTTNVHFHGVHGSPKVDDVFSTFTTGEEHLYKLSLPRDHEPGMHWYHAHSHGSVYQQVMGGLFGAIVIGDGQWMVAPQHPFNDWDDTVLLFHLYRLATSTRCDGTTMDAVDAASGTAMLSKPQIVNRDGKSREMPAELFMVNGQHRPTVNVQRGRPMVLRMVYAAGSCHLNMTIPPQCTLHVFAVDGVQLSKTKEWHWAYFTAATRVEGALMCSESGRFAVHHTDDAKDVLFHINSVSGGKKQKGAVFPVALPKYTPDYLYLKGSRRMSRDISFSQQNRQSTTYVIGQGEDCSSLQNSSTCYYSSFAGSHGNNTDNYHGFAVPLHTVITARVFGDPTDLIPHPLHLHVNHFQLVSFEPRPGGKHENHTMEMYGITKSQFRDTIPILDGVTTIRWQAATYLGEVVYHCHGLHHEDRGMMQSYLVYPDWNPPPRGDGKGDSSGTSAHVFATALFAMLLVSAALAVIVVGIRYYREDPERDYGSYARDAETMDDREMQLLSRQRGATEETPLVNHA